MLFLKIISEDIYTDSSRRKNSDEARVYINETTIKVEILADDKALKGLKYVTILNQ